MGVTAFPEERDRERYFPRGRELAGILAFWAVFAALSVTNWIFPPAGQGPDVTPLALGIGVFEWVLWAAATPPIFWLTSRYSVEHAERVKRIVLYLAIGVAVAFTIDIIVEAMRTDLLPPPPPRGRFGPRERSVWAFARGRFLNHYIIFLGVLAAGVARDYFRRYQRRLQESAQLRAQLAEARLTALQSQLNPHFLFNTLNAVATLVDRDPRGVRRMIVRLSELLRATLEPSNDPEVPVSRELMLTERYFEILEIRFQGRLTTSIDAPREVRDALVPPLVLQPLIENAMTHAVSKTSNPSRIDVKIARDGYDLVLSVADTGPADSKQVTVGTGIGLANTRARLEQLYGDESVLTLQPNAIGGHTAVIRLPYHTVSDVRAAPAAAD